MTSAEIRQSFLDFFKSKGHTLVPSSSLMPDSPNLLFTNAGMNQFVPIFLAQRAPDVTKWAGAIPGSDTRAADTQKCIRAGGKHNDLDDVGLDTYHHTFFEMLGNWSFGDYFKKEAIDWAWELVTEVWKFPKNRLYATVYSPDKSKGDPSEFDQEAYDAWAAKFRAAGLDPKVHIVNGNKKDNFWMMGDTGPCGPCSELHVDLTPQGDTKGRLVNHATAACIEIWNLVFIQFNANPDGTFSPLPAKHVDTGMGFERVTGIIQNTKSFTDFSRVISNYETDIFRPIFDKIEKLSGKKYGSTLPAAGTAAVTEQEKIDIAFRVIGDHIRTLSFAIADNIQPGNTDRNYVLRRILRRAVRYGRTLGFHEPFFYKLVAVLADKMGHVFPELRAKQDHIEQVIQREEEAFNRTLDRGLALFEEEVARLMGSARVPRVVSGVPLETRPAKLPITIESAQGSKYSKRNLPHFERPWAKYMVTFTTVNHRQLSLNARDITLNSLLFTHRQRRWQLFAACVMPDHVHVLFEPQIKEQDPDGNPVFWSLTELLHSVKSFTAHEINKAEDSGGGVWQKESFDRLIRSDADLEEKFHYICRNPWDSGVVPLTEPYQWLWTPGAESEGSARVPRAVSGVSPETSLSQFVAGKPVERSARRDAPQDTRDACAPQLSQLATPGAESEGSARVPRAVSGVSPETSSSQFAAGKPVERSARRDASQDTRDACAPQLSGAFAFRLYDEQGFPLDLTELMVRERGLTVDVAGFNKLMEEQKARARAAQKKQVIELSQVETATPTQFVGYDKLEAPARVLEVVGVKDKTAVILDSSPLYAEMGGQVGDTGELRAGGQLWPVANTQKSGNTWLHFLGADNLKLEALPDIGSTVTLFVHENRRRAIERHHTVTHLLHWALHKVVSEDAVQKGSYVGPEKLTFDFSSAPLTPQQVADVERVVNERILENAPVAWTEVKYSDIKDRKDIMQFFGEKYGDVVRVVQIGGKPATLDGYSMELCGGTHTRATGEIGLFRIVGESAIAAGIRRIEAVSGLEAYKRASEELQLIKAVAGKVNSPVGELEKKIEVLLAQQKDLEKQLKAMQQKQAAEIARGLVAKAHTFGSTLAIVENLGAAGGDYLQSVADSLKGQFKGVVVLGGLENNAVSFVVTVNTELTKQIQAGKIIQTIAPIVGGKGGGRPDNARGGGKDVGKLDEALAKAKSLLG